MTVENTDQKEFDFTALLHTYLNVDIQSMTGKFPNIQKKAPVRVRVRFAYSNSIKNEIEKPRAASSPQKSQARLFQSNSSKPQAASRLFFSKYKNFSKWLPARKVLELVDRRRLRGNLRRS